MMLPRAVQEAIDALSGLPGIGSRSAERLVFSLLKNEYGLDQKIATSLGGLRANIKECAQCFHLAESDLCAICQKGNRESRMLCVVETPQDLIALERTHEFKGLFHVLHGVISPIDKVKPEDLRIPQFLERVKNNPEIEEIILATSGNIESDATALYLSDKLKDIFEGRVSRIARGIPTGGDLDYLDAGTLSRALVDRRGV